MAEQYVVVRRGNEHVETVYYCGRGYLPADFTPSLEHASRMTMRGAYALIDIITNEEKALFHRHTHTYDGNKSWVDDHKTECVAVTLTSEIARCMR